METAELARAGASAGPAKESEAEASERAMSECLVRVLVR